MSRSDEIAQGLREESGALIGGLHVEDYAKGIRDFKDGTPPPKGITSTSYDLGRRRAREDAELTQDVLAEIDREQERRRAAVRELLSDHPDVLAQFDAQMAAINPERT